MSKYFRRILVSASVIFWGIVIFYAITQAMARGQYGVIFLGSVIVVYLLSEVEEAVNRGRRQDLFILGASGIIVSVVTVYLTANFRVLNMTRVGYAFNHEYVLAALFILVVLYLSWRTFGLTFASIIIGAYIYAFFGDFFPGILHHSGFSVFKLLRISVLEFDGVYGFLNRIVATWVALFLLYAGLLKGYGMFDIIHRLALRSSKYIRSGVAQSAVFSSIIIGSINGSPTANVGITGSFTIPLMKENGMKSETAGGIESVASCSGQVLPPVMGASAFIMANLLGITYVDVILAGLIPALIMSLTIAVAVHFTAVNQVMDPKIAVKEFFEGKEQKTNRELSIDLLKFLIPFFILVYSLGVIQFTVMTSALYTSVSMMVMGVGVPIVQNARSVPAAVTEFRRGITQTIEGFEYGAVVLGPVAIILAAINIVVDLFLTTGVPSKISLALVALSGGIMLIAVIIAMVMSIFLGLGMPTSAAYILVALLIAPSLIQQFGIPELSAHYFVFYSAVLAAITPPIAAAVAVAAGIAQSDFWRTAYESIKIAGPLFILPFSFIYHPEIVSPIYDFTTLSTAGIVLVGALSISFGLNYHTIPFGLTSRTNLGIRAVYVVLGIFIMAHPNQMIQTVPIFVIAALYLIHIRFREIELGTTVTSR